MEVRRPCPGQQSKAGGELTEKLARQRARTVVLGEKLPSHLRDGGMQAESTGGETSPSRTPSVVGAMPRIPAISSFPTAVASEHRSTGRGGNASSELAAILRRQREKTVLLGEKLATPRSLPGAVPAPANSEAAEATSAGGSTHCKKAAIPQTPAVVEKVCETPSIKAATPQTAAVIEQFSGTSSIKAAIPQKPAVVEQVSETPSIKAVTPQRTAVIEEVAEVPSIEAVIPEKAALVEEVAEVALIEAVIPEQAALVEEVAEVPSIEAVMPEKAAVVEEVAEVPSIEAVITEKAALVEEVAEVPSIEAMMPETAAVIEDVVDVPSHKADVPETAAPIEEVVEMPSIEGGILPTASMIEEVAEMASMKEVAETSFEVAETSFEVAETSFEATSDASGESTVQGALELESDGRPRLSDEMVTAAVRQGLSADLEERVRTRAYFLFKDGVSCDREKNYFEALRHELSLLL
eukprot:TRINITY_DN6433_c0_g1_i2.p1 TRINITY_DN6433_c0_g1~~TRINITY_DN6433_c0_g1_i2.p1  ORF type:complete len:467 (-),score=139.08 TRINITY_DN6433_c0_g1_i2:60-1460(-)